MMSGKKGAKGVPEGYELHEHVLRDGRRHPFAVICPGGGYSVVADDTEGRPYAERLNELGCSAFVVHYRCQKAARFPAPQEDLSRAIHDIFSRADRLGLDTRTYSIWGSSAGGHLAASVCTREIGELLDVPRPCALVLAYPVVTMGREGHDGTRENHLGWSPVPELLALTSIERLVGPDFPPTFVWCGSDDASVDPENSRMLARALQRENVPCEFREYAGVGHAVGLGEGLPCQGWLQDAAAFWMRHAGPRSDV